MFLLTYYQKHMHRYTNIFTSKLTTPKHKLSAGEGASPPPPFDHARILLTHYPVSEVNAQPKYTAFNAAVTDIGALRIRCDCQTKSPHPNFLPP